MKNILIMGGVGVAVFMLMRNFSGQTVSASQAYTAGGLKTTDTKGREIQFQLNKDGFLVDQFGGVWA